MHDEQTKEHLPASASGRAGDNVRFTILQFPYVSRNTDFEPLFMDPQVEVRFARLTHAWGNPDAILIPGGSRTADAMRFMNRCGAARRLRDHVANGGVIFGICGGYQMLGQSFYDPQGIDGRTKFVQGLDLLPVVTRFSPQKLACTTTMTCLLPEMAGVSVQGREGRYGRSQVLPHNGNFLDLHQVVSRTDHEVREEEGLKDGLVTADRRVWGTYLHRIFENAAWNDKFFTFLRRRRPH